MPWQRIFMAIPRLVGPKHAIVAIASFGSALVPRARMKAVAVGRTLLAKAMIRPWLPMSLGVV